MKSSDTIKVVDVKVGHSHRVDFGDIDALAADIQSVGLIQPIAVTKDGRIIGGRRRLKAVKKLGWETIPCHRIDLAKVARGELSENFQRLNFSPDEYVALGKTLEPELKKAAKERMAAGKGSDGSGGRGKKKPSDNLSEGFGDTEALSQVAKMLGVSRMTYERASAVVDAALEHPKKYGALLEEMHRTRRVNGVAKKLKVAKQVEEISKRPPPMPTGPFDVIVADPPWKYDARESDASHRTANPYTSMSNDDIVAYAKKWPDGFVGKNSILWLWTTNAHMRLAFDACGAWGFQPKTILTWVKNKMGTGDWLRGKTEHCLMCVRGKPLVNLVNQTTALTANAGRHSAKPDEFYALVDALCPGAKVELFCRTKREGWTGHGLEVA